MIRSAFALAVLALSLQPAPAAEAPAKPKVVLLVPGLAADNPFSAVAVEAARALERDGRISLEIHEKLADPVASEPVIRRYAARGADLIIGHGIELSDPILRVARQFPSVRFAASGGLDLGGRLLPNVDGWTFDFAQQGYLAGWVVGKIPGLRKVGLVGGPELPFVRAIHAGFKAGLAETAPKAETAEIYTGSFDDVQKAAEATRGLIDQGAQLVWTSGDGIGNGVAAAAQSRGVHTLGVSGSAGGLAAKVNIATVELDLKPLLGEYVQEIRDNKFGGLFHVSTIANHGLVLAPVNRLDAAVPADLPAQAAALAADLASGARKLPDLTGK